MRIVHKAAIPLGVKGELSKIEEEVAELKDVYDRQDGTLHGVIECADIIESVGQFAWAKYRAPLVFVLAIGAARALYKPCRNRILDIIGRPKESYFQDPPKEE